MRRALACVLLCGACALDPLDKPTPPDTRAARRDLVAPTGSLGALSVVQVSVLLFAALDDIQLFCGCVEGAPCTTCAAAGPVASLVRKLSRSIADRSGDAGAPTIAGVDATLAATSICRGWGEPSPDPAHGQVAATVNFTGRGLDPVVWGRFERCEDSYASVSLRLDGTFIYTFEPSRRVPLDELDDTPVTLIFDGTIYDLANDRQSTVHTAVRQRFDGQGSRELLIYTTDNGTFTAVLEGGKVDFRGQSLHLRCDLTEETCEPASL